MDAQPPPVAVGRVALLLGALHHAHPVEHQGVEPAEDIVAAIEIVPRPCLPTSRGPDGDTIAGVATSK